MFEWWFIFVGCMNASKTSWWLALTALYTCGAACAEEAGFPRKPISVVVYTKPGGLIDTTARKFTTVATNYTDATFVVENKPGAGGILAIRQVVQKPADGYTLFACTKSNVAKLVASRREEYIDALDWVAMLMADPECIITRDSSSLRTWEDLRKDAEAKAGEQIWVGPAVGGLDHVMALKVWLEAGISAKWIPFKSGGKAIAALLGDQGVAYVGNPRDASGNADLRIAAVSSPERLAALPEVPTFSELGLLNLDKEYMWRGFALKKGTPPLVQKWYADLFSKVAADPQWRSFWVSSGIDVLYKGPDDFSYIIAAEREDFRDQLTRAGIITRAEPGRLSRFSSGLPFALATLAVLVAVSLAIGLTSRRKKCGTDESLLLPAIFFIVGITFLLKTWGFSGEESVGPGVVPQLWITLLCLLSLGVGIGIALRTDESHPKATNRTDEPHPKATSRNPVASFIALLVLYLCAIALVGYFISTFVFLPVCMTLIGYRSVRGMLIAACAWLVFSYFVFVRLFFVPLPRGWLFDRFL